MARDIAVEEGVEDAAAKSQALDHTMGPNPDGLWFRDQESRIGLHRFGGKVDDTRPLFVAHYDLGHPGAGGLEGPTQPGAKTRLKGGVEAESQRETVAGFESRSRTWRLPRGTEPTFQQQIGRHEGEDCVRRMAVLIGSSQHQVCRVGQ